MELINKIRKSRKGFTLVEIIVVLVILAILAAFTIPSMLGFIDEAKGKALMTEAREVYVAAQAVATEYKGTGQTVSATALDSVVVGTATAPTGASLAMKNYLKDDLKIVTEIDTTGGSFWTVTGADTGNITAVVYTKNGYEVTLSKATAGSTTVTIKKL